MTERVCCRQQQLRSCRSRGWHHKAPPCSKGMRLLVPLHLCRQLWSEASSTSHVAHGQQGRGTGGAARTVACTVGSPCTPACHNGLYQSSCFAWQLTLTYVRSLLLSSACASAMATVLTAPFCTRFMWSSSCTADRDTVVGPGAQRMLGMAALSVELAAGLQVRRVACYLATIVASFAALPASEPWGGLPRHVLSPTGAPGRLQQPFLAGCHPPAHHLMPIQATF